MNLFNTFLRDEGDPSGNEDPKDPKTPELEKPDPNADPQVGDPKDPSKKEGLSAEEKAELKILKTDKTNLEKRLSDTQESFRSKSEELKGTQKQLHDLKNPPEKPDTEYANDSQIRNLDSKIKAYEENNYDTSSLVELKSARVRELKLEKRLSSLEGRSRESDEIGKLLLNDKTITDFEPAGRAKAELSAQGQKVSIETAHYYQLGKDSVKSKEDFDKAVKEEVQKQLEAEKKANGARGQDGGYEEPPSEENKEMEAYADELSQPGGFELE